MIRAVLVAYVLMTFQVTFAQNKVDSLDTRVDTLYFRTHIDDYLQYSPFAIAYGLDALGVKSKNSFRDRNDIVLKAELGMMLVTHLIKNTTRIERPDQSNHASFPSGHTAQAFVAATFLSEEYKGKFKWIPYASYGIASSVGSKQPLYVGSLSKFLDVATVELEETATTLSEVVITSILLRQRYQYL